MSDDVLVLGVGMTRFTKTPERPVEDLGREAVRAALTDAGVEPGGIGAAVCGSLQAHPGIGQRILKDLPMSGIPIMNVENACASGTSALWDAANWIKAGVADVVLAIGIDKLSISQQGIVDVGADDYASRIGFVPPAGYALLARRHMDLHGTSRESFARVAVKSHRNAMANAYAHFHKPLTLEEVLASPVIADPITLYQCCPNVDGAAAVVLGTPAAARRLGSATVRLAASVLRSGRSATRADVEWDTVTEAGRAAYEAAGLGPADVSVAEVHDAFAPAEILAYEELGFCERGAGGDYIDSGRSEIGGGGVAVNPGGGILSRGHPFGATGLAQVAEVTWQLRGQATGRQVEGARVGLTETMGGTVFELEASACAVHVLVT